LALLDHLFRHTFVPRIRYLGFTTRGKKGPLTTTGDLSACKSKRTLIQLLTVNTGVPAPHRHVVLSSFPLYPIKGSTRARLLLAPLLLPSSHAQRGRLEGTRRSSAPRRRSAPPAPLPPFRAPRGVPLVLLFISVLSPSRLVAGRPVWPSPASPPARSSPGAAVRRRLSASSCCPPSIAR
jgi:hypothetical protein